MMRMVLAILLLLSGPGCAQTQTVLTPPIPAQSIPARPAAAPAFLTPQQVPLLLLLPPPPGLQQTRDEIGGTDHPCRQ